MHLYVCSIISIFNPVILHAGILQGHRCDFGLTLEQKTSNE